MSNDPHTADDATDPNDSIEKRRRKAGPFVLDIEVDPVDPSLVRIGTQVTGPTGHRAPIGPAGEPEVWLRHNRIRLALHRLREARDDATRPLLLLHGLGEHTSQRPPEATDAWLGAVWGLDFTGHGRSSSPRGGGYTAEILMADVDAALAHLGTATVLGRGLGAYVALLIQGARPALVRGAVLVDGPGIVGGGIGPSAPRVTVAPSSPVTPDPFALAELTVDVRPPDYAVDYLRLAVRYSGLGEPVTLAGNVRPPWMAALQGLPGVRELPVAAALEDYAAAPGVALRR
ncbi:MAG: alpha/beta fold hydrolase [Actinobacteria bacterium]|nr:alpha/beta fold hydrolase [Actinomycetota bacterium]